MSQQQQPFATVPHGYHYHYDEQPHTPERELSSESESPPAPQSPNPRGFRVRRRRPALNDMITDVLFNNTGSDDEMELVQETTLPSIEVSESNFEFSEEQLPTVERLLTPFQQVIDRFPQTPSDGPGYRDRTPALVEVSQETFAEPLSPFSGFSDSEDEGCSIIGSEDGHSHGDSVTSSESETDQFVRNSSQSFGDSSTSTKKFWTKEMDAHLWSVFTHYRDDPTVTPFKTMPGTTPPMGVCHRVASEARRTWKGLRLTNTQNTSALIPLLAWPGAGSATRRRLRELCRRKAFIIPHYQRMAHPEDFTPEENDDYNEASRIAFVYNSSPRTFGTRRFPQPLVTPVDTPDNAFTIHDVALSLATSTSATMQPEGPLNQMTMEAQATDVTPTAITDDEDNIAGPSTSRLRSPFVGSNTWTGRPPPFPSLSNGFASVGASTRGTALGSPMKFARMPKRPATSELEDGGINNDDATTRRIRREDNSGTSFLDASRRLRLRGMSLGAHLAGTDHYASEPSTFSGLDFTAIPAPQSFASLPPGGFRGIVEAVPPQNPFPMNLTARPVLYALSQEQELEPQNEPVPRLRSPFPGIGTRPSRGRHASSLSLPSVSTSDLEVVDQRMSSGNAE